MPQRGPEKAAFLRERKASLAAARAKEEARQIKRDAEADMVSLADVAGIHVQRSSMLGKCPLVAKKKHHAAWTPIPDLARSLHARRLAKQIIIIRCAPCMLYALECAVC